MGKKGVLLDNGKKAQSSMALYWKYNKEKSKLPREKKEVQKTPQQQMQQRATNNFKKWKQHKEKMITKAYVKPVNTTENQVKQSKIEQQQQDQVPQKFDEKPKQIYIPGYGSKQNLSKKLKAEKVPQVNQQSNVLKLPPQYSGLTQDDIMQLLRSKKNRKNFEKRNQEKQEQEDIILGADLFERKIDKKREEEQPQKQIQPIIQEIPKQQQFFKSDILNKIIKGIKVINQDKRQQKHQEPSKIQQVLQQQQEEQKPHKVVVAASQRFIPRVLRK